MLFKSEREVSVFAPAPQSEFARYSSKPSSSVTEGVNGCSPSSVCQENKSVVKSKELLGNIIDAFESDDEPTCTVEFAVS